MNWTQAQESYTKAFKKIDKIVEKLVKNPTSKNRETWINQIVSSGLYDIEDLNYLLKLKD